MRRDRTGQDNVEQAPLLTLSLGFAKKQRGNYPVKRRKRESQHLCVTITAVVTVVIGQNRWSSCRKGLGQPASHDVFTTGRNGQLSSLGPSFFHGNSGHEKSLQEPESRRETRDQDKLPR